MSAPSTAPIVACTACGGKNRLRAGAAGRPACGRCQSGLPWLVDTDTASFEREVMQAPLPVLVDFWASWCAPCRAIAPALQELSRELAGRLKVVKVDVDQNPVLASRHDARSIPTLLVFNDGAMVERTMGAQPKAALRRLVEPYLPAA
ncbi:MAG: thioredoxin [Acidobacteriota bacterium]